MSAGRDAFGPAGGADIRLPGVSDAASGSIFAMPGEALTVRCQDMRR
ncbi:MAG TPA: hypothetical protein PKH39_13940 [Woeseiaceae bacterium]|nr:hypothetical protein [Woeseiaceae bacterium]